MPCLKHPPLWPHQGNRLNLPALCRTLQNWRSWPALSKYTVPQESGTMTAIDKCGHSYISLEKYAPPKINLKKATAQQFKLWLHQLAKLNTRRAHTFSRTGARTHARTCTPIFTQHARTQTGVRTSITPHRQTRAHTHRDTRAREAKNLLARITTWMNTRGWEWLQVWPLFYSAVLYLLTDIILWQVPS